ncbi:MULTISPECIES: hypothetical protein [unclassified Marinovum]
MLRTTRTDFTLYLTLTPLCAVAIAGAFRAVASGLSAPDVWGLSALLAWAVAALARPIYPPPGGKPALLRALSAGLSLVAALIVLEALPPVAILMRLCAVVLLIALIADLAACLPRKGQTPAMALFVLVLALATAPIWAGPFLVQSPIAMNAAVALNPLAHLWVQADVDPFRTGLFYGRTPIGDMRYTLPDKNAVLAVQLAVAAGLWAGLSLSRRTTMKFTISGT